MAWSDYKGPGGRYLYYLKCRGVRRAKVVNTHEEGKTWLVQERKRILAELSRPRNAALMFSKASADHLEACAMWMRPGTIQEKFRCCKDLVEFVGRDFAVADLDTRTANQFKLHALRTFGAKAANRRIQKLSALWSDLVRDNLVPHNPWRNINLVPEEEPLKQVPTPKEVAAILLAAQGWEQDFLNLLLLTAARPGEIRNLRWDDVNFQRNTLLLWTRKRKGGRRQSRPIPLSETLNQILTRRWKARESGQEHIFCAPGTNKPWERNHRPMKFLMKRLCKKAQVPHFDLYSLRHYVAQRLADSGKASLVDVQHLLGHQRPTTTDGYLKSLAPDLAKLGAVIESEVKVQTDGTNEEAPTGVSIPPVGA